MPRHETIESKVINYFETASIDIAAVVHEIVRGVMQRRRYKIGDLPKRSFCAEKLQTRKYTMRRSRKREQLDGPSLTEGALKDSSVSFTKEEGR